MEGCKPGSAAGAVIGGCGVTAEGKTFTVLVPFDVTMGGHTPGHSIYMAESKGERMVFWGDLMHVASVQFENPAVTIRFDSDSKAAAGAPDTTGATGSAQFLCQAANNFAATPQAGATCTVPAAGCGASAGQSYSSPPPSGLCADGTSPAVTTNASTYSWSCGASACSATRTAPSTCQWLRTASNSNRRTDNIVQNMPGHRVLAMLTEMLGHVPDAGACVATPSNCYAYELFPQSNGSGVGLCLAEQFGSAGLPYAPPPVGSTINAASCDSSNVNQVVFGIDHNTCSDTTIRDGSTWTCTCPAPTPTPTPTPPSCPTGASTTGAGANLPAPNATCKCSNASETWNGTTCVAGGARECHVSGDGKPPPYTVVAVGSSDYGNGCYTSGGCVCDTTASDIYCNETPMGGPLVDINYTCTACPTGSIIGGAGGTVNAAGCKCSNASETWNGTSCTAPAPAFGGVCMYDYLPTPAAVSYSRVTSLSACADQPPDMFGNAGASAIGFIARPGSACTFTPSGCNSTSLCPSTVSCLDGQAGTFNGVTPGFRSSIPAAARPFVASSYTNPYTITSPTCSNTTGPFYCQGASFTVTSGNDCTLSTFTCQQAGHCWYGNDPDAVSIGCSGSAPSTHTCRCN